jgi:hypothetical protein
MDSNVSKTMVCPKCGNVVAVTDQFCSKCFEKVERPSFWRRLGAWFQSRIKLAPNSATLVLTKDVRIESIGRKSVKHVYHSLDEVPPEFRAAAEKLKAELDAKPGSDVVSNDTIIRENIQEFKIKNAFGKEQVYHSLNEMPPETRALFEKLQGRLKLPE